MCKCHLFKNDARTLVIWHNPLPARIACQECRTEDDLPCNWIPPEPWWEYKSAAAIITLGTAHLQATVKFGIYSTPVTLPVRIGDLRVTLGPQWGLPRNIRAFVNNYAVPDTYMVQPEDRIEFIR